MKKFINVRIPLFCAMGLIVGIIACHELLCGNFYFGVIMAAALAVGLIVALIVKRAIAAFALLLCFALVGFGITELSYNSMEGDDVVEREVVLQGRVCDLKRNGYGTSVYYLENCTDVSSGEKFRGRVEVVYYNYSDPLQVGEVVTVSGVMYSTYPVKNSVNSFYVRNRIYYELVSPTLTDRVEGKVKFDEKARRYVYDIAMEYAPENGGIIYALLTGDRNAISDDVKADFSRTGTIHLLAVSGLHVGFVVTVIAFVLKRLRLHPLVECAIMFVPLLFYAYLCGFAPSIVRAVIMTTCLYLSRAVLGKYDLLSSLSISAIIVLFATPYTIFDAGFQLSFLSVFGIATIHTPVMRWISQRQIQSNSKRKINKVAYYFINAILLSLSCSLATLLTLATCFNQVPILGVFVNLIAIPLISVIFALSVIGMLPWIFHYVLFVADKLLVALVWLNRQVSSLSFATVSVSALAISAAIGAVLLFVLGGFVNVNKLGKRITAAVCSALLVATVLIATIPRAPTDTVFVGYGYRNNAVIAAVSKDGCAVIVSDFSDASANTAAVEFLSKYRLKSCALCVTETPSNRLMVDSIVSNLPVDKAYALTESALGIQDALAKYGIDTVYQPPNTEVDFGVTVRSVFNGTLVAVTVRVGKINVCLVTGKGDALNFITSADFYVLNGGVSAYGYADANGATFSRYQSVCQDNYGANKYGNFTIKQKDDRIVFNFS